MKKKNSTRLAKKPAVNPAVELAKEGEKKKKDVSIEFNFKRMRACSKIYQKKTLSYEKN